MEFIYQLKQTVRELSNMTNVECIEYIKVMVSEELSSNLKNNLLKYYIVAYNLSRDYKHVH